MFFADLTLLRSTGTLEKTRVEEARKACAGGTVIGNLQEFKEYLDRTFPPMFYFEASLTSSSGFPDKLSKFFVSVTGRWTPANQHGLYATFGAVVLDRLRTSKESMPKEKYRDELAGAYQHYANGLAWAAKSQAPDKDSTLDFPCFDKPLTALEVAQEAVRTQRIACTLRSEKYASPGMSKSHYYSYKSALENLATNCEILADLEGNNGDGVPNRVILTLRQKAASLHLADSKALEACIAGMPLSAEAAARVASEKRSAVVACQLVPRPAGAGRETPTCKNCMREPPTMTGFTCRCKCLCEACVEDGVLMECPACGDYTEFVLR